MGDGQCSINVPFQEAFERPGGVVSGQVGAARKEGFCCTAKILKIGRRLIYGTVECVDSGGRLLTYSTVTYIRAEK